MQLAILTAPYALQLDILPQGNATRRGLLASRNRITIASPIRLRP
jgi:hypothetical protein